MKSEEKLLKLLGCLTKATSEEVNPQLAEEIKTGIPHYLKPNKGGFNTIKIMIDLRINKLTAAAAIIITILLCANLLSVKRTPSDDIYKDSKLVVNYLSGRNATKDIFGQVSDFYKYLVEQSENAVYYGDIVKQGDAEAILVYLKLSDGNYMVRFADLHTETVSAEQLVRLQTRMLQRKLK